MSSAISCVVIKSDFLSRSIPVVGQLVRVDGESGLFVAMEIDSARRVAKLMEKSGKHRLMDVAFGAIRPLNHRLARAIRCFLDAIDDKSLEAAPQNGLRGSRRI